MTYLKEFELNAQYVFDYFELSVHMSSRSHEKMAISQDLDVMASHTTCILSRTKNFVTHHGV